MKINIGQKILIFGLIGAMGSLLYFLGDMILYFTTAPFDKNMGMLGYAKLMSSFSIPRIMAGGFIGPFAAFLFCIGHLQLTLAIKPKYKIWTAVIIGILVCGEIIGGAYHTQFGILGFMYPESSTIGIGLLIDNISVFGNIIYYMLILGFALLSILIITGKTAYPRWFFLITPLVVVWLNYFIEYLPQPFYIIFSGGWTSLIYLPYFIVSTILLLRYYKEKPCS
jgi:hypothetical protein